MRLNSFTFALRIWRLTQRSPGRHHVWVPTSWTTLDGRSCSHIAFGCDNASSIVVQPDGLGIPVPQFEADKRFSGLSSPGSPMAPQAPTDGDGQIKPKSACRPCRSRKIKCNGLQPVCSTCVAHDRQCEYDKDGPRRRYVWKAETCFEGRVADSRVVGLECLDHAVRNGS